MVYLVGNTNSDYYKNITTQGTDVFVMQIKSLDPALVPENTRELVTPWPIVGTDKDDTVTSAILASGTLFISFPSFFLYFFIYLGFFIRWVHLRHWKYKRKQNIHC